MRSVETLLMNLLTICLNAFIVVLGLLSSLALTMRLLIALFPERQQAPASTGGDAAQTAAVAAAVAQLYPGARLTRMEEIR